MGGRKSLVVAATALVVFVLATGVAGAYLASGEPIEGSSWSHEWDSLIDAGATQIDAHWLSPEYGFAYTDKLPFSKFDKTGNDYEWDSSVTWELENNRAVWATAKGASAKKFYHFTMTYSPPRSHDYAFTFDIMGWRGNELVEFTELSWTQSSPKWHWEYAHDSNNTADLQWARDQGYTEPRASSAAAVPEPASLCLLALAVGGIGVGLKKRKKA